MKILSGLAGLFFVGLVGWRIGATLTPDAIALAIGVLIGTLAGIPIALMVLTSGQQPSQQQRERTALEGIRNQYQLRPEQYQPPIPNVIFIAPHIKTNRRGYRIQHALESHNIHLQFIESETDGAGRTVYDFSARVGTRVSTVSRFVETELSQLLDSNFRAARAGSMIQIFEYRPQNATVEIEREQLSVRNDNW